MAGGMKGYLEQLLRLHWLRPETALWRTFDCLLMEKYGAISGRAVDLGCGDGTMSFIMAGGKIGNYDAFKDVGNLKNFNAGADIHDQDPKSLPDIDYTGLRYEYERGFDHKDSLVKKASRFGGFYRKCVVSDLNARLDCEDESLDSGFSNVLYWLQDVDWVLSEWARIFKRGGRLHLFVPTAAFKDMAWLNYAAPHSGDRRYLNFFDRGYGSLIHHCYGTARWIKTFQAKGFSVKDHHLYLTKPVMELWNVGTRPIAPLLIQMANMLSNEKRDQAIGEWVEYFSSFFCPIVEGEMDRRVNESEAAFHFFVLEKS